MSNVVYGSEKLYPTIGRGLNYDATRLMLEGVTHKIFITPEQRDDTLEGYGNGFILEINDKRIGCYWSYENEFDIEEDGTVVWNLNEVGIEPSMSSTNQFTTHRHFVSEQEMNEGLKFIKAIFGEYDGAESSKKIDGEVKMIWEKRRACRLQITSSLQTKISQGRLISRAQ